MTVTLTNVQMVPLTVRFLDAAGNPARVDGVPEWSSSDPAFVDLRNPSTDGMSIEAFAVGPVGMATVTVTGDADLGPGVREVSATIDVEVTAGEAVSAVIDAGTPEAQ